MSGFQTGQVFDWCGDATVVHPYIILNDSSKHGGEFVAVNLTESTGGSEAMVFRVGDHPRITKDSDVNFGDAFVADEAKLNGDLKCGLATAVSGLFDMAKIEAIVKRAKTHPAVSRKVQKFLDRAWPHL